MAAKVDNPPAKSLQLKLARTHPRLSRLVGKVNLWRSPRVVGPRDNSDLIPPGRDHAIDLPYYYLTQPVHQMQGMHYLDPRMGRVNEQSCLDFTMNMEENVRAWVADRLRETGIRPKRILDIGTGPGFPSRYLAEWFPEAEVIGIDLSPALLRWAKLRAHEKGLRNVQYYQLDGADLSCFADGSFDWVHDGHTLHEMPGRHSRQIVREMVRVVRPGGLLTFFDWAIPKTQAEQKHREFVVRINQEPFMVEYAKANFPRLLQQLGCEVHEVPITRNGYDRSSATWYAVKGAESDALVAAWVDDFDPSQPWEEATPGPPGPAGRPF